MNVALYHMGYAETRRFTLNYEGLRCSPSLPISPKSHPVSLEDKAYPHTFSLLPTTRKYRDPHEELSPGDHVVPTDEGR
jgi:hypothetical protein